MGLLSHKNFPELHFTIQCNFSCCILCSGLLPVLFCVSDCMNTSLKKYFLLKIENDAFLVFKAYLSIHS